MAIINFLQGSVGHVVTTSLQNIFGTSSYPKDVWEFLKIVFFVSKIIK